MVSALPFSTQSVYQLQDLGAVPNCFFTVPKLNEEKESLSCSHLLSD